MNPPDNGANHNSLFAAKGIRDEAGDKSTEPRTGGHRSSDASLNVGYRSRAADAVGVRMPLGALIEVTFVLIGAKYG